NGGQTGEDIILFHPVVTCLQAASVRFSRLAKYSGEGLFKAGHVRAALWGGDDIHKASNFRIVTNVPSERDVAFAGPFDVLHLGLAGAVEHWNPFAKIAFAMEAPDICDRIQLGQVIDEFGNTAVVLENFFAGLAITGWIRNIAFVPNRDTQSWDQERSLTCALF